MSRFFQHAAAEPLYLGGDYRVNAATLAGMAYALAARLPDAACVLNLCDDRLLFLAGFGAALLRGQPTLLPGNRARQHLTDLLAAYPRTTLLVDDPGSAAAHAHVLIDNRLRDVPPDPRPLLIDPDAQAAVLFTSGSTGAPAAHRKTWRMLTQGAQRLAEELGAIGTLLSSVPQQHMFGLESTIMLPLQSRLVLAAGCPLLPQDVLAALQNIAPPDSAAPWWMTTPLHLRACVDSGLRFPPLAGILCATQTLPTDLAHAAEACFQAPLHEIYGCTEAGMIGVRRTAHTRQWRLCDDLELMQTAGNTSVSGLRSGEALALHDDIECLPDRHFLLHGRHASLIKIGGKRMHLDALNELLLGIPGVRDGAFFQPVEGGRLIAFVVAPALDRAHLHAALRERIDPVFLPRPLHLLAALPRNSVGKLPHQALVALTRQCTATPT